MQLTPVSSNIVERALKRAIRHRKNSMFYRSERGAVVGDCFMSLIHTAERRGINPFEYLVALIRYAEHVEDTPADWMPWNYTAAAARLEPGRSRPRRAPPPVPDRQVVAAP